jgi:DNA-binding response OmpR family regulator
MSGVGLFKRLFGGEDRVIGERRIRPRQHARPDTRFLIIDDSTTIVTVLRRMLQQNGFATREAYDAERGIEIAEAEVPHLIFLDIVLPGMSGFEALRHLRRSPATRNIPIIMISGNEQATEQFYLQRIGADDFMKKPFNRDEVFSRISRLLGPDLLPHRPEGSYILRAAV